MRTVVKITEYKGNPVLSVWEVDEDGDRANKYPIISLGRKKLGALMSHSEEIAEFLEEEEIDL